MVETSDDRNGVVVNRARRGTCDRLNKRHSDRLNKRHSESSGRREVQHGGNRSSEMEAKNEDVRY